MAEAIFNTRPEFFVSRFLHMLSTGLLVGTSAVPFLYKNAELAQPKFFMIAAAIAAVTGFFNAHALQPARMKEAGKLYRLLIYFGKTLLLILLSPLLEKLLEKETAALARFMLVALSVAVGTWSRYYREKHTPPKTS